MNNAKEVDRFLRNMTVHDKSISLLALTSDHIFKVQILRLKDISQK